jgi:D-isomer specific 2-hydroxyacid dehydrogenase, NAD binding domain
VLGDADVLVVSLPLTNETRGRIGARELSLMKPDAILILISRAAIVDEDALYEHLRSTPSFSAGIDAWWQEPRGQGTFAPRRPFLDLPNVVGSPHNSAITGGSLAAAARYAAANVARFLRSEPVHHLVDRTGYPATATSRKGRRSCDNRTGGKPVHTKLLYDKDPRTVAAVFDSDDEAFDGLVSAARERALKGAGLTGIGGFRSATSTPTPASTARSRSTSR